MTDDLRELDALIAECRNVGYGGQEASAMLSLLDKLGEKGWEATLWSQRGMWSAIVLNSKTRIEERAVTLPEAVARAAAKTITEERTTP